MMRTARLLPVSPSMHCAGGGGGGICSGGVCSGGRVPASGPGGCVPALGGVPASGPGGVS